MAEQLAPERNGHWKLRASRYQLENKKFACDASLAALTRIDYRFRSLKTTIPLDCSTGAIMDVHCATTKPHDTKIGWQVLQRNTDRISTITADKGYDWDDFRSMLRENGVRPVIKHREFDSLDAAHNARLDDIIYHRRSVVETVFRVLKQRYGDRLRSRSWYRQFREFTLKCAVKNRRQPQHRYGMISGVSTRPNTSSSRFG